MTCHSTYTKTSIGTYCSKCRMSVIAPIDEYVTRVVIIDGEPVRFYASQAICPQCGHAIDDIRLMEDNIAKAYKVKGLADE